MFNICRQLQSEKSAWALSPHADATFEYIPTLNNNIEVRKGGPLMGE